jgi:pyruvate/2-oxoglutarate dehydrogenase complex dihydrolipoamide dehydrogenase (E3) component
MSVRASARTNFYPRAPGGSGGARVLPVRRTLRERMNVRIAINGAGIAGTALAFWLQRASHKVLLVETAPRFRTDGYIIDFLASAMRG